MENGQQCTKWVFSGDRNKNNIARTAGAAKLTPVRARMQTIRRFFMLASRGVEALFIDRKRNSTVPLDGKKWDCSEEVDWIGKISRVFGRLALSKIEDVCRVWRNTCRGGEGFL